MSIKLTKRILETECYDGKTRQVMDTDVQGFGIRIGKTKKTFFVRGRVKGKSIRRVLGYYPDINLVQARKLARAERVKFDRNINPAAEEDEKRTIQNEIEKITVRGIYDLYADTKKLKPNTLKNHKSAMKVHLLDWLDIPMASISREMVLNRFKAISKTTPSKANNVLFLLKALFDFSQKIHLKDDFTPMLKDNPVQVITALNLWNEKKRKTDHIPLNQLKHFWHALEDFRWDRREDFIFYVRLVLLTGLRKMEALTLSKESIDFHKQILSVTGKNGLPLYLPYGPYLAKELETRLKPNGIYFPGSTKTDTPIDFASQFLIFRRTLLDYPISIHGLRRTFSTIAEHIGIPVDTISRLMNHKLPGMTQTYIQKNVEDLRSPMQKIESFILETVS